MTANTSEGNFVADRISERFRRYCPSYRKVATTPKLLT